MLKSFPPCSLKPHGAGPFRVTVYVLIFCQMSALLLPTPCSGALLPPVLCALVLLSFCPSQWPQRWLPPSVSPDFTTVSPCLLPALRTNTLRRWWWCSGWVRCSGTYETHTWTQRHARTPCADAHMTCRTNFRLFSKAACKLRSHKIIFQTYFY